MGSPGQSGVGCDAKIITSTLTKDVGRASVDGSFSKMLVMDLV